MSLTN